MNAARYERRVRDLEAFGHRGSATPQERRAAKYLAGELRASGITPVIEPFRGARSFGARVLIHIAIAAIGLVLSWRMPAAGIALAAAGLISFVLEQWRCVVWLSWPACQYRSQNVCGTITPSRAARRRIILCAHYDTQRSGMIWTINRYLNRISMKLPLWLKPPMTSLAALMMGQIILCAVHACVEPSLPIKILEGLVLAIYAVVAALFIQYALGRSVPGAVDNASGVAAVLELADAWIANPPADDVELAIVLSGCEESVLMGAAAWADRHRQELARLPSVFLNLDSMAFGPPRFLGAEVPAAGLPMHADDEMIKLCKKVAEEQRLVDAGPHALPGPTDGYAFLARGMRGISIVSFQEGGVLPRYHTMADTADNMDFAAAHATVEFARRVCWKMASARERREPT
jgi:peptidase M28-like protein